MALRPITGARAAQDDAAWRSFKEIILRVRVVAKSKTAVQLHRAAGIDQGIEIRISFKDAAGDAYQAVSADRNNGRFCAGAGVAQELYTLSINLPAVPVHRHYESGCVAAEDDAARVQTTISHKNGRGGRAPSNGHIVQIQDGASILDVNGKGAIGRRDDAVTVAVDGELAGRKMQNSRVRLDVTVAECAVGGQIEGGYSRIRIEL